MALSGQVVHRCLKIVAWKQLYYELILWTRGSGELCRLWPNGLGENLCKWCTDESLRQHLPIQVSQTSVSPELLVSCVVPKIISCGCKLESPRRGDSNTHQHMTLRRNSDNYHLLSFWYQPFRSQFVATGAPKNFQIRQRIVFLLVFFWPKLMLNKNFALAGVVIQGHKVSFFAILLTSTRFDFNSMIWSLLSVL